MYVLECNEKYANKLPIPNISSRYSSLSQSDKKNIIIVKEQFNDPTFRYRGYNMVQTMEGNEKYNVNYFLVRELELLYDVIDKIDLVIMQRALWSFELENFINVLKANDIKIIYDVDDLIYNTKYVPKYMNSVGDCSETFMNHLFAIVIRYELIAKMCDGYIVTTDNLKANVEKDMNKPVWVFHNYINLEQEEVSEKVVDLKKETYVNDKFIMGYFSGSNSHKRDLEIIEPDLVRLMNKHKDIYLNIVGYMNLPARLQKLKKQGRIVISKYVPYEELQYEIGKVDLNLVPLQKHTFNECKSELKYFEASIVNTLTLATDNSIYKACINDGVDGFLADEMSWFEKMEYIYLNHYKLTDVVDNARTKCLEEYSSANQEKDLEKMYDDIFDTLIN